MLEMPNKHYLCYHQKSYVHQLDYLLFRPHVTPSSISRVPNTSCCFHYNIEKVIGYIPNVAFCRVAVIFGQSNSMNDNFCGKYRKHK